MTKSSLVLPVLAVATAAIAACSSKTSSTNTSPAPSAQPAASTAPSTMAAPARGGLPAGVTAQMVAMGDSLFHAGSCVRCHGADAKGRPNGPDLTSGHFMHITGSYDEIVKIITTGVPADSIKDPSHKLPMRGRGGASLTDDQIKAVAAYVYKLSHS